jgi:GntR family transcriptional regulator
LDATDLPTPSTRAEGIRPGIPLHEQISSWLREAIRTGTLPPDSQLPSEHDLCARFEVSRVTVRRALQTLEADGLIFRRQGLGSFVCDHRVTQGLVRLTDFAQDLERAGMEASSRVLHQGFEPCPNRVAEFLALEEGAPVYRLDRLRLGNGDPLALDRTWIPPYYAQLLDGEDLAGETLYRVLEWKYGIPVLSGRYRITAALADPDTAEILTVAPGEALLLIERTTRTVGEKPLYYQRRLYRSDRIAYELELARDPRRPEGWGEASEGMPLRDFEPVFHPAR